MTDPRELARDDLDSTAWWEALDADEAWIAAQQSEMGSGDEDDGRDPQSFK